MAQPGHCGRARRVQRPRDGLVLAPSVSTSSAILCLQRGKVRLGCVSLLSFTTSVRTHLICPTRTLRTHTACATAPQWLVVGTICVDQLNRPVPAAWQGSTWMRVAPFIHDQCADPSDLPNPDATNALGMCIGLHFSFCLACLRNGNDTTHPKCRLYNVRLVSFLFWWDRSRFQCWIQNANRYTLCVCYL